MCKFKKNQTGFTTIEAVLILVIIFIICGVGFFVYHYSKKANSAYSSAASSTSSLNSTKKSTAPAEETFTTIKSSSGFSFSYPASWSITAYNADESANGDIEPTPDGNATVYLLSKSPIDSHDIVNDACVDLTIGGNPVSYASMAGNASKLSNGLQLWQIDDTSTGDQNYVANTVLETVGQSYVTLPTSKTLNAYASFACGQGMSTTYSYSQQIDNADFQSGINILKSVTLN